MTKQEKAIGNGPEEYSCGAEYETEG